MTKINVTDRGRVFAVALCALFLYTFAPRAEAGLFFCNETGDTVSVAVGWSDNERMRTAGWRTIKPQECTATNIRGPLRNPFLYFYANSSDLTWEGTSNDGITSWPGCAPPEAFDLYVTPACQQRLYRRIFVQGVDQYTLYLTEERTDPLQAANYCAPYRSQGIEQFSKCWISDMATARQRRILDCITSMCAVGRQLTPEQQKFADCAIATGGVAVALASCYGSQVTISELKKCIEKGIGGDGCFGTNNSAVVAVRDAWRDVTQGPGPNNDLFGRDGFTGRTIQNMQRDLEHGPGETNDLVGKRGWLRSRLGI